MNNDLQLSPEELKVYEVIKRETKASGGIKQTQIRKHPELRDIDPKRITQIIRKLAKLNLIERTLLDEGGKRSYLLMSKEEGYKEIPTAKDEADRNMQLTTTSVLMKQIDVDLLDIPCIKCKHLFECGVGRSYDPLRCPLMTSFVLEKSGTNIK